MSFEKSSEDDTVEELPKCMGKNNNNEDFKSIDDESHVDLPIANSPSHDANIRTTTKTCKLCQMFENDLNGDGD